MVAGNLETERDINILTSVICFFYLHHLHEPQPGDDQVASEIAIGSGEGMSAALYKPVQYIHMVVLVKKNVALRKDVCVNSHWFCIALESCDVTHVDIIHQCNKS